jgi:hypothetical protein
MTVTNPSFEIAGVGSGAAQSWLHSGSSALYTPTSIRAGVGVGASTTSNNRETYALVTGQTLTFIVNALVEQTITFVTADFVAIGTATAAEIAAVITRDAFGVIGSVSVDEEVVITTVVTGPNATLEITGGTATVLDFTIATTRGSHASTIGVDSMENYWRSPLGFNIQSGETADPYIWAQALGSIISGSTPITYDLVVNAYVVPDTLDDTTDGVAIDTDAQSARATITSSNSGPYSGLNTLTFKFEIDGGTERTTTFGAADDTATEVITAIQATIDTAVDAADATLDVHGTSIVLTSRNTGATASVKVTDGTANTILGFTNNTTVYGRDYITATLRYGPYVNEDDALVDASLLTLVNGTANNISPDDRQDATAQMPLGATTEFGYPLTYANGDIGFGQAAYLSIDSIDANAVAFIVHGCWTQFPMNEVDLFALTSSDITELAIGQESFETSWDNDGGLADDFSLVPSEPAPLGVITNTSAAPYNLEDGYTLIVEYDDDVTQTVEFYEGVGIVDIDAVTAQELINVININLTGVTAQLTQTAGGFDIVHLSSRSPLFNMHVTGGTANAWLNFPTDEIATYINLFESFERGWWNAPPTTPPEHLNDEDSWGFENYIESTLDAYEDNAALNIDDTTFVITTGINDLIAIYFSDQGTLTTLIIQLAAATYANATAMAAELASKIDTALNADVGTANSSHFSTSVSYHYLPDGSKVGRIQLITAFDVAGVYRPYMELKDPPNNSAWATLGFITNRKSQRTIEANNISIASFDTTTPEAFEDFEEEWLSNEDSILVFTTELTSAVIGADGVEAFETTGPEDDVWTLTLTV